MCVGQTIPASGIFRSTNPKANTGDLFNVQGYTVAEVMERFCAIATTMSAARTFQGAKNLKSFVLPMPLPGITIHNGPATSPPSIGFKWRTSTEVMMGNDGRCSATFSVTSAGVEERKAHPER